MRRRRWQKEEIRIKQRMITDQETWWPAPYCQQLSLKWGYKSDSHWPGWDAVAFVLSLSLCSVQLYDHLMRLYHSTAYGGGCKIPPPKKKKETTISLDVDPWHHLGSLKNCLITTQVIDMSQPMTGSAVPSTDRGIASLRLRARDSYNHS